MVLAFFLSLIFAIIAKIKDKKEEYRGGIFMKILHINSYYSDTQLYKNLFDKQIEQGIDLDVFVSVPTNYEMPIRDFGKYTLVRKNHHKWDRIWFGNKQRKMWNDLEKHYATNEYDLIHAHSLFTNGGLAYRMHKKYGTNYIVAVRNTDLNTFFKRMPHLRNYGVEIMKHAKKIIFISDIFKKQLLEKYVPDKDRGALESKMITIPNGIDQIWLDNSQRKPAYEPTREQLNIIYVGKIMKIKNVPTVVDTCEELISRGYDVSLKVIGKVVDEGEFEKIKDKSFLSYESFQPMSEIIEKYRSSDIFIMPSFGETFGLVYVEAMSQGVPVLYTKGQGFDGQFPEGDVGYHVNPHSPIDIADKVEMILNNYDVISQNCSNNAHCFNWNDISRIYLDIYKKLEKG